LKKLPREEAWKIREAEARRAGKILGLAELFFLRQPDWTLGEHIADAANALLPILKRELPELIYLPHALEWHPDHKAALPIVREALLQGKIAPPKLRGYEVWTPMSRFDEIENISPVMPRKLRAVRAHKSQSTEFNYAQAVRGLNEYRGALAAKSRYAEVFQILDA
jgi:N-acetylglucosamine malate deacetylase 1